MPEAARERTVSFRPRAPHSLRIREYPRPKASFTERDSRFVAGMETNVKWRRTIGDSALESLKAASHPSGMKRRTRPPSAFSKVSVKSQTVIPREVRERLRLEHDPEKWKPVFRKDHAPLKHPGDTLRYRMTEEGILLDKAPANEADDPFATFSEWSNEADEKAYGDL